LATKVVDRVHQCGLARPGHDGAAVLEAAVVSEDDVQQRPREIVREFGDRLDFAAYAVVAERDLSLELPGVRLVGAAVGLELSDVVRSAPQTARSRSMCGKTAAAELTSCAMPTECSSNPPR
jgi:hypothetical protein